MSTSPSKGRILIVDDEQLIVATLEMSLEQMGYSTTAPASTGEEAVKIAASDNPDLVLMDINLPGAINGIDAAKMIFSRFRIRSIFVSGYPHSEMASLADGPWSRGYITKPYSLERLQSAIEVALDPRA